MELEAARIDRWLWAVRIFKTRSLATDACRGGRVTVNGTPVKAASAVRIGDLVEARVGERLRIVDVARVLDKRVGAPIAAECIVDHSPPPPRRDDVFSAPVAVREPASGRPTKRERRQTDRFRGGG